MCVDLGEWLAKLSSLTFAQLANVQTVGIGLYLALAIIQAVSDGGVAGLRRRADILQSAITSARKTTLKAEADSIQADLRRLEMGFQKVNRTILLAVLALFTVSIVYFAYCTVWQGREAELSGSIFIFLFYLLAPLAIFVIAASYIRSRCAELDKRIKDLQAEYLTAVLGG